VVNNYTWRTFIPNDSYNEYDLSAKLALAVGQEYDQGSARRNNDIF